MSSVIIIVFSILFYPMGKKAGSVRDLLKQAKQAVAGEVSRIGLKMRLMLFRIGLRLAKRVQQC